MISEATATTRRNTTLETIEREQSGFTAEAQAFVMRHLRANGATDTETLTDLCKAAGIAPATGDQAFGGVTGGLSRRKLIEKVDVIRRRKGNMTYGNVVWQIAATPN